jgi:nucleoside-diphosphate-sugar epimerase
MHVLVTGATGFIGLHLCEALLRNGFEVSGISRSVKSISSLHARLLKELDMYRCDISQENDLIRVFDKLRHVDGVFHLAAQNFMRDLSGLDNYFRVNFQGTLNILERCRAFKIKKFVHASTYTVYGLNSGLYSPNYVPVDESHICRPCDFYDISKYLAEQLCKFYHDRFSINMSVLRYSKVYGPGLERRAVYEMVRKALSNLPITVDADITDDYVYVDDVVQSSMIAYHKTSKFDVYNIGSGLGSTLYELCSKITQITNSKSKIIFRKGEKSIPGTRLDISKARKKLNYNPLTLEKGLTAYVRSLKDSVITVASTIATFLSFASNHTDILDLADYVCLRIL